MKQAEKFLGQDDKVKLEILLRGRERQHKNLAYEVMKKFIDDLNKTLEISMEQPINIQGGKVTVLIAKK
jgi:translation initiation factor IF-3